MRKAIMPHRAWMWKHQNIMYCPFNNRNRHHHHHHKYKILQYLLCKFHFSHLYIRMSTDMFFSSASREPPRRSVFLSCHRCRAKYTHLHSIFALMPSFPFGDDGWNNYFKLKMIWCCWSKELSNNILTKTHPLSSLCRIVGPRLQMSVILVQRPRTTTARRLLARKKQRMINYTHNYTSTFYINAERGGRGGGCWVESCSMAAFHDHFFQFHCSI